MGARPLGGEHDLVLGGVGPGVGDVLGDGAVEQRRVLRHHGDGAAQAALGDLGDVLAVDQDPAALQVVEPLDQLDEGRLARARRPDQRQPLARRDAQGEVVVERRLGGLVAEHHPVEDDLAQLAAEARRAGPSRTCGAVVA